MAFASSKASHSLYSSLIGRLVCQVKVPTNNIGGEIVKDNETYLLRDNKLLKNLVVSSTLLLPGKETRGHSHDGQEEVYFFQYGYGEMTLGEETFPVAGGETVLIPDGAFHKVKNTDQSFPLYFVCVFDGKRYEQFQNIINCFVSTLNFNVDARIKVDGGELARD